MNTVALFLVLCVAAFREIKGHGRLIDPPGRSTAWRYGFDTPRNYNDNELNCGGIGNQWEVHGGKCGLCGDPYLGPRKNEYPGGKFATGTIVAKYTSGSTIDVTVQITANHKGYHQFRLCKKNNSSSALSQSCLDQHLLVDANGKSDLYMNSDKNVGFTYRLQLPTGLTCSSCVLQWKWHCGNRWGTDPQTGEEGLGFGAQEEFYGCADIAITSSSNTAKTTPSSIPSTTTTTKKPVKTTTTTKPSTTATNPTTTTTQSSSSATTTHSSPSTTTTKTASKAKCIPTPTYQAQPGMATWCDENCFHDPPFCPASHCICLDEGQSTTTSTTTTTTTAPRSKAKCVPTLTYKDQPGMETWCDQNCFHDPPFCPATHCICLDE